MTYSNAELAIRLTNERLLTESEIVARCIAAPPLIKGVYFLVHDQRVVYVGQGVNIYRRIAEHRLDKIIDGFYFIPCSSELLNILESLYIYDLIPELNGNFNGRKYAPIRPVALQELAHKERT